MCAEKEKKGRKNIKAVIRCKLAVFVRLCVSYWRLSGGGGGRGFFQPTLRSLSLAWIITSLIGFPFHTW